MDASTTQPASAASGALDADRTLAALAAKLALLERRLARRERQINEVLAQRRTGAAPAESAVTPKPFPSPAPPTPQRAEYPAMVARIRELVEKSIPSGATVLVVSRGDDELLKLGSCHGWHFPQNEKGIYAGHHPADSAAAIRHLEELCARGGQYLVLPATAFWWLEHYGDFHRHLQSRYTLAAREDRTARIFDLRGRPAQRHAAAGEAGDARYGSVVKQLQRMVESLLPADAKVAVISRGDPALLQLGTRQAWHLPADESGRYAGHHPADGAVAVAQVKAARVRGAQFLVIPSTARWWLEFYQELPRYLQAQCRLVQNQPHVGIIFEL